MTIFRSFRSTVTPFIRRVWPNNLGLLVDPITGAPAGIESPNANGADGIWTPVDVTPAQVASPSSDMLNDLNATYRLNIPPYTRLQSDGAELVELGFTNVIGPNGIDGTVIIYSPLTVTDPAGLYVRGTVYVRSVPA